MKVLQIFSNESNEWVDCDKHEYDHTDDDKRRIVNADGNRIFVTEISALEASTGEMRKWAGENVYAETFEDAQKWCDENKGYLKVVGQCA